MRAKPMVLRFPCFDVVRSFLLFLLFTFYFFSPLRMEEFPLAFFILWSSLYMEEMVSPFPWAHCCLMGANIMNILQGYVDIPNFFLKVLLHIREMRRLSLSCTKRLIRLISGASIPRVCVLIPVFKRATGVFLPFIFA